MGLFNWFTQEIAIDLGTANTLIIHNDKVVVDEPSIVAFDRTTNKIIAIGRQAMQMEGKTHDNIRTVRPLKDGVIADFNAMRPSKLVASFSVTIGRASVSRVRKPRCRARACSPRTFSTTSIPASRSMA